MLRVGLTGSFGTGKSTVAAMFAANAGVFSIARKCCLDEVV